MSEAGRWMTKASGVGWRSKGTGVNHGPGRSSNFRAMYVKRQKGRRQTHKSVLRQGRHPPGRRRTVYNIFENKAGHILAEVPAKMCRQLHRHCRLFRRPGFLCPDIRMQSCKHMAMHHKHGLMFSCWPTGQQKKEKQNNQKSAGKATAKSTRKSARTWWWKSLKVHKKGNRETS